MAEQEIKQDEQSGEDADIDQSGGGLMSSMIGKVKILAVITVVIVVECLAAYMYIPSPSETAALAGNSFHGETEVKEVEKTEEEKQAEIDQIEVDLGSFSVTSFQPISNTTLRIDFHLFGTVATENVNQFEDLKMDNEHRFREQVIVTVRSADVSDLTDAGLGLLKRKILEKTNRLFGKALLNTVIFSEFSFIEQ